MSVDPFVIAMAGIEACFDRLLASHRRLRASHDELLNALRDLVGLTQLLLGRDDLPIGIREALAGNHSIIEAKVIIAKAEDSGP